jgi:oxaloacetate decarboxylase alpha subunit
MKHVSITETVLRDANQSLVATRTTYSDFSGILETMDQAGYYSLECWGGATFDSCLRYLHEDPWERLHSIREKVKAQSCRCFSPAKHLVTSTIR